MRMLLVPAQLLLALGPAFLGLWLVRKRPGWVPVLAGLATTLVDHWVVLAEEGERGVRLLDPLVGVRELDEREFATGSAGSPCGRTDERFANPAAVRDVCAGANSLDFHEPGTMMRGLTSTSDPR